MAKRGQNEGSIYKRADGRWVGVVSLGYGNGRRCRKYVYGRTRREAQEKLLSVLNSLQNSLPVAPERQTVSQFLAQWLESVARPRLRPRTFESYDQYIRLYIDPALGRLRLARLAPGQIQAFLNELPVRGLSPRTAQYCHAILRTAL